VNLSQSISQSNVRINDHHNAHWYTRTEYCTGFPLIRHHIASIGYCSSMLPIDISLGTIYRSVLRSSCGCLGGTEGMMKWITDRAFRQIDIGSFGCRKCLNWDGRCRRIWLVIGSEVSKWRRKSRDGVRVTGSRRSNRQFMLLPALHHRPLLPTSDTTRSLRSNSETPTTSNGCRAYPTAWRRKEKILPRLGSWEIKVLFM